MKDLKGQLREWGIEVDTLKARAEQAGAGARAEIDRRIEVLRGKQTEASSKLQELMRGSGSAWDDIARGFQKAVRDVQKALDNVNPR